jgi:ABC-2 type transport system ATP-binding protein
VKIIDVDHATMRFRMVNDKVMSLKEYIVATLRRRLKYEELTVLDNVSFTINRGEVVGIVGKNGAGKSTLLKLIAGVLKPTSGKISTLGNVVPMLELGSGFDPELSGRENIYLNGAILGYSKEFLDSKYQEILEFSELEDFIEMPLRNYSSGMKMRLAFSVATIVRPEILIVDEILAVGDGGFQRKSKTRMLELMGGGTTVLLVSHSIDQIQQMCERVIWLENHKVKMNDKADVVCNAYREYWN